MNYLEVSTKNKLFCSTSVILTHLHEFGSKTIVKHHIQRKPINSEFNTEIIYYETFPSLSHYT